MRLTHLSWRLQDGVHLTFHEAHPEDYAGMTRPVDNENLLVTSAWWDQTDWVTRSNVPYCAETPGALFPDR